MRIAITRQVSRSFESCQLTHLARQPIDLELARRQHAGYEHILALLGCEILQLPEQADLPDAVFVEDTAIVLDELAVIARPGSKSRRPEVRSVLDTLRQYRTVLPVEAPGTLDGGDILSIGKQVFAGLSSRTNRRAVDQLVRMLKPFGYQVIPVTFTGCLHLKSAVTQVGPELLLLNRLWIDAAVFKGFKVVEVDPAEPLAANALLLDQTVVFPREYPATKDRLEAAGCRVQAVEVSEIGKAEGGVTCCSLIFKP